MAGYRDPATKRHPVCRNTTRPARGTHQNLSFPALLRCPLLTRLNIILAIVGGIFLNSTSFITEQAKWVTLELKENTLKTGTATWQAGEIFENSNIAPFALSSPGKKWCGCTKITYLHLLVSPKRIIKTAYVISITWMNNSHEMISMLIILAMLNNASTEHHFRIKIIYTVLSTVYG